MKFLNLIKIIALIAAVLLSLSGCIDKDNSHRILTKEGYTNINFTGYGWFSCSRDDTFRTNFTATKDGKQYEGTVCNGLFSGAVVRIK